MRTLAQRAKIARGCAVGRQKKVLSHIVLYFCNLHNTLFLAFVCLFEEGVENPQIPCFSSAGISVEVHRWQAFFSTFCSHFSQLSVFELHWLRCQRRALLNARRQRGETTPLLFFSCFFPFSVSTDVTSARMFSRCLLGGQASLRRRVVPCALL